MLLQLTLTLKMKNVYCDDDYRTGCRNVSHCQQQQSYSGRSSGRSNSEPTLEMTPGFKPFTMLLK